MEKISQNLHLELVDDIVTISLTPELQEEMGDVAFVEITRDKEVQAQDSIAAIEASKAVLEIASPISGKITDINISAEDKPSILNSTDPHKKWLVRLSEVSLDEFEAL